MKLLKDVYNELVKKVIASDTSRLVKKTDYDAWINKIKGEIPSITDLATTVALNAVKNERSSQEKRLWCKTSNIESKHFTTSNCNKFLNELLDAKIKKKK